MFSNAKFRWFLLAPILLAISVVVNSPVVSLAESLEDAQEQVRLHPNDAKAHHYLGQAYHKAGQLQKAIASYKEAIRIKPDYADSYNNLGNIYIKLFQFQEAIAPYKEAIRIRIKPEDYAYAPHYGLGAAYSGLRQHQKAATEFKEVIRIKPDYAFAHYGLGVAYEDMGRNAEAIAEYREALRIDPNHTYARNNLNKLEQKIADERLAQEQRLLEKERKKHKARKNIKEADRLAQERRLLEEERKKWEVRRIEEENRQQQALQHQPAPGGTGFLFSSRDYIITNYHVVKGASSIEVKFPNGEIIKARLQAKDSQNDIAVLKLAQSPSSQIPDLKFGDSSKVRPGDRVFTIGYPASSILGKNQKITDGIISSVTGIEDDPTMFQITVPIQPGNSGGPLFNERGEVIGITTASLSLNAIQSMGAIPQNVNYAIKSSFVNNLLTTIPKTLLSNRGIVVVPNKPGNSLSDFFERVSNNIVLIEAKD